MYSEKEVKEEVESLLREHGAAIRRQLRGRGFRKDVIEDAIIDGLLAVMQKRRSGDLVEDPKAFLFVVAYHAAIRKSKALHAVEFPDSPAIELMHDQPERDDEDRARERKALRQAIMQLAPRQREVIELRFLRGFSVADTAAIMGIKAGTVGPATTSAVRNLKQILTEPAGIWEEETR
jgi:RNA polymerase sigma-70 factor, ECF subfamily